MPTISIFYGVSVKMFFNDNKKHNIPHIHVEYQNYNAVYSIDNGELLSGDIPNKKHKIIVAWIEIHKEDLLADWKLAVNGNQVFRIKGLDQ